MNYCVVSLAFNPFSVKECPSNGHITVRFDSPALNALEVETRRNLLSVEQILHDKEIVFGLYSSCLKVLDFHGVESHQLGQN